MSDDALRARLEAALAERDEALRALAIERERVNALTLRLANLGEPEPPRYPPGTGPGEPPLRYVLADRLNDGLKRALSPLQRTVKRVLSRQTPE